MTEEPTERKIQTEVNASFLSTFILSTCGYGDPSMETAILPDDETTNTEVSLNTEVSRNGENV